MFIISITHSQKIRYAIIFSYRKTVEVEGSTKSGDQGMYVKFLLKIKLDIFLRKTGASLNFKIKL
jgi:hypothetical protein